MEYRSAAVGLIYCPVWKGRGEGEEYLVLIKECE
jgi:hypothetical protein